MLPNIPRISVYIITYNQEDVIERTLSSVLSQLDYVYEICVSDDCSSDRTWEILQDYSRRYPGLFKLNRNDPNVGIFQNTERVWKMPTGDIVYDLAGDDEVCEGWFREVVRYIEENGIEYKNDFFCIYGDYKCVYPNGDSFVFHNDLSAKSNNLLKLALRGLVVNRSCCYSRKVLEQFREVSQGRSHIAEDAQDRQLQIFAKDNYYIPYVGNIYYTFIGVSSHMDEETLNERKKIRPYALSLFESWGIVLDKKDKLYSLECFPAYEQVLYKKNVRNIIRWLYLLIKSYDSTIPRSLSLKHTLFAVVRRFPHKHSINWS